VFLAIRPPSIGPNSLGRYHQRPISALRVSEVRARDARTDAHLDFLRGLCPSTSRRAVSHRAKLYTLSADAAVWLHRLTRLAAAAGLVATAACGRSSDGARRITPEYDKKTGRLTLLKYDSNGNGRIDTWSYMDGARVVRIEIDKDEDGKIDRWEYYGPDQTLTKVGYSRANDGKEDAWSYLSADGSVERVEISTKRDGKVTRVERYQKGALASAEEDTDGDGRMDKWETYEGQRLASVAFDTRHRGGPDRRLLYRADGSVAFEIDRNGDGHFVAANASDARNLPSGIRSPQSPARNPR
jgi:EF hand